jgi:hypothetical protein
MIIISRVQPIRYDDYLTGQNEGNGIIEALASGTAILAVSSRAGSPCHKETFEIG